MTFTPLVWTTLIAVRTSNLNHMETQSTEANAYSTTYYAVPASPAITGAIYAPTAAAFTTSTQIATTAFVQAAAARIYSYYVNGGYWSSTWDLR